MPETSTTEPQRGKFREIAEIEGDEGLVAVITERESDGKISFCIFRRFYRDLPLGKSRQERSTYLGQRHILAQHKLLAEVDRRLAAMEERARGERRAAAEQP